MKWGLLPAPVKDGDGYATDDDGHILGDWTEPWIGRRFSEWDDNAMLTAAGLTVAPVALARLSIVERGVLGDWAGYWSERVKAARDAASEG